MSNLAEIDTLQNIVAEERFNLGKKRESQETITNRIYEKYNKRFSKVNIRNEIKRFDLEIKQNGAKIFHKILDEYHYLYEVNKEKGDYKEAREVLKQIVEILNLKKDDIMQFNQQNIYKINVKNEMITNEQYWNYIKENNIKMDQ